MRGSNTLNSRYVKGTKWAVSSVATCAAALSFMIVTNATQADATADQNAQANVQTTEVQPATNTAATQAVQSATPVSTKAQATQSTTSATNAATVANTQASEQPVATANDNVPSGGTVEDDYPDVSNNVLGVAAYFHIFSNDATLNAHTNGNLAVKNLDGKVNFGTNVHEELVDKEISYIQNITSIANSSFVSAGPTRSNKVIFGENVDINTDNPRRVQVDGTYIDHLDAGETYQDKNGQVYIDFEKEFNKLKDKSTELANTPTVNQTVTNSDFDDMNNRVIDVSDYVVNENNHIIINLDPEVLNSNTPLIIKGLSSSEDGPTVIFNVETDGNLNYNVNSPIKLKYDDGTDRDSKETEYFGDNHLLWNFTDNTDPNNLYTGTINVDAPFQGSVLAPGSTINVNQNLDGNIIADKVNVNAETHRWDLQDDTDFEEEEEEFEKPDITNPGVEMPDIEEPEEPEPETPGTETPGTEQPGTETPGTENPDTETPGTENPDPENPNIKDPDPDKPGTEIPGIDPDPETPDIETPGTEEPDVETPGQPDTDGSTEGEGNVDLITDPDDEKDGQTNFTTPSTDVNFNNNATDANKQGTLPQTGAEHSLMLTAVGLVLAAGLAFVYRRKRD